MVFALHIPSPLAWSGQGRIGGLRESADEDSADAGVRGIDGPASRPVCARPHGRSVGLGLGNPRAVLCEF